MLALQVLEDTRVLSLLRQLSVFFRIAIKLNVRMISYLDSLNKGVVDIFSLHFLTNKVGNATKNSINRANLAVPGKESGDSFSITTGRFGASINVYSVALAKAQLNLVLQADEKENTDFASS